MINQVTCSTWCPMTHHVWEKLFKIYSTVHHSSLELQFLLPYSAFSLDGKQYLELSFSSFVGYHRFLCHNVLRTIDFFKHLSQINVSQLLTRSSKAYELLRCRLGSGATWMSLGDLGGNNHKCLLTIVLQNMAQQMARYILSSLPRIRFLVSGRDRKPDTKKRMRGRLHIAVT